MRGTLLGALLAGGEEVELCYASALVPTGCAPSSSRSTWPCRRIGETRSSSASTASSSPTTRSPHRDGLRVTTIERTLFDIAPTGADIRHLAQEALAKRLTTRAKLQAMAERHKGERGAPALRRVAGEPHTRSDLERRFLRFLDDIESRSRLWNEGARPVHRRRYWPQFGLVVEVDEDAHQ